MKKERLVLMTEKAYDKLIEIGYSAEIEVTNGCKESVREDCKRLLGYMENDNMEKFTEDEIESLSDILVDKLLDYDFIDIDFMELIVRKLLIEHDERRMIVDGIEEF